MKEHESMKNKEDKVVILESNSIKDDSSNDNSIEVNSKDGEEAEASKSVKTDQGSKSYVAEGMIFGMLIGIIFGESIFGNTSTGLAIGMSIGLAIGTFKKKKN